MKSPLKHYMRPLIVIEHLEDVLSKWLIAEYKHSISIYSEGVVFTRSPQNLCSIIGLDLSRCFKESIFELRGAVYSDYKRVIILDPRAENDLISEEARDADVLVVGGILGDHPPRGRTFELLTSRAPKGVKIRRLGPYQLSIDGAVYVVKKLIEGYELSHIDFVINPSIKIKGPYGIEVEVVLPYAYPRESSKLVIAEEVLKILSNGVNYETLKYLY